MFSPETVVEMTRWPTLLEIFVKILTKTLPRSMQDSDIKNHGRIRPENGTRFIPDICVVHACKILTRLSHGTPSMIKLWCTQDPYKDRYARFLTAWLCIYI